MRNFIALAAFAAGTNALVGRTDSCCFHLTSSGGAAGKLGQLGDGQNRIGDNTLQPAQYCIDSNGAITDSTGRGCILTPPTTQLQCDDGVSATPGFSVNSQGKLEYHGSPDFVACATGQNGGLNVYTTPNKLDVTGCVNIQMSADTCSNSGAGGGNGAPSVGATHPSSVPLAPAPQSSPAGPGPGPDVGGPGPVAPGAGGPGAGGPGAGGPGAGGPGAGGPGAGGPGAGGPGAGGPGAGGPGAGGPGAGGPGTGGGAGGPGPGPGPAPGPATGIKTVTITVTDCSCPTSGPPGPAPGGGGVVGGAGGGPQPSPSVPAPSGGASVKPPGPQPAPGGGGGGASQPGASPSAPAPGGGGGASQPGASPTAPAPSGGAGTKPSGTQTAPGGGGGTSPSAPAPGGGGGGTTQSGASPSVSAPGGGGATQPGASASVPATGGGGGGGISISVPPISPSGGPRPTGSSNASVPASSATSKLSASGTSGGACPTDLSGNYEIPHLIIPVDSSSPSTTAGTGFNGTVSSTTSTLFNFDIPAADAGKTCSLIFLFPKLEDLETSSYSFSGDGKIDFAKLSSTADSSTNFGNMPSVSQDLGTITVNPGSSYLVSTFSCPAGQAVAYEMKNAGTTHFNFFEDWNPSPLGLYITTC
ncbi:hypothetical protein PENCOP_c001G00901 [Penicillium coprophilum]|uniref:Uncharacterized protein n=1 Tax=Penicillium coprophilum TaxID=36646 RepID=A0A1V6V7A8_9EURO|nr:hypothetical protein PENCOP_c001G00901 [Penicillium coprophilum]